jgi:hypothetical protein
MLQILKLLVLFVAGLAWCGEAIAQSRIALLIGNSRYSGGTFRALPNPVNDVRLLEETLGQLGFKVETLIDADARSMERAIEDLGVRLNAAGPEAIGLFYFAGHGVQIDGRNYLVPIESRARTQQDLFRDAIRMGEVEEWMRNGGNRVNFIILDACRDNGLPATTRSSAGGLAPPVSRTQGFLFAYATAPGQTAADGSNGNSPYALALAEVLKIPGLPAEMAFKRVADRVATSNPEQFPYFEAGLRGQDFCFAGCAGGSIVAPATMAVAPSMNTPKAATATSPASTPAPRTRVAVGSLAGKSGTREPSEADRARQLRIEYEQKELRLMVGDACVIEEAKGELYLRGFCRNAELASPDSTQPGCSLPSNYRQRSSYGPGGVLDVENCVINGRFTRSCGMFDNGACGK